MVAWARAKNFDTMQHRQRHCPWPARLGPIEDGGSARMMPDGYDDGPWPPVAADLKGEPAAKVELGGFASAGGSARVNALGLARLADSCGWMGSLSPQFHAVPVEAMAFSCAAVSPWRTPAELVTAVRMHLWIFAFDDHIERSDLVGIDDMLQRCADVVRGKARDDSHWLL